MTRSRILELIVCVLMLGVVCHAGEIEEERQPQVVQSHVSKQVQTLREASCTRPGLAELVCGECHAVVGFQEIETLPHNFEMNTCTICGAEGSPIHITADTTFGRYTELVGNRGITCLIKGVPEGTIQAASDAGDITNLQILLADTVLSGEERDAAAWESVEVGSRLTFPSGIPLILYARAEDDHGNIGEVSTDFFFTQNSAADSRPFYLFCASVLGLLSFLGLIVCGSRAKHRRQTACD